MEFAILNEMVMRGLIRRVTFEPRVKVFGHVTAEGKMFQATGIGQRSSDRSMSGMSEAHQRDQFNRSGGGGGEELSRRVRERRGRWDDYRAVGGALLGT